MTDVAESCKRAKENLESISLAATADKNEMIRLAASAVIGESEAILKANASDISHYGGAANLIDRLVLNKTRLKDIAEGLIKLIELDDPIGETIEEWTVENGMNIRKVRVPLGVIGIIYEARPNVTADAIGLCIKSGNAVVLRGSKEAYQSNCAIVGAIKTRLKENGYNPEFIQIIEDTTREGAEKLMRCRESVDVLIPRGSAALIRTVVEKSNVPVIETGAGNCHAYIEKTANAENAVNIVLNGKLRRPSVCNALESLLIDESVANELLPVLLGALSDKGVEIVGCDKTRAICPFVNAATEDDYYAEYLTLKISVKVVSGVEEACKHINKYSTKHSEVIVTESKAAADYFTSHVDSACVYVNASTAFTDGFQFGYGAEMGISTQKLHARGPLGLKQLTSEKYIIRGSGQTRA